VVGITGRAAALGGGGFLPVDVSRPLRSPPAPPERRPPAARRWRGGPGAPSPAVPGGAPSPRAAIGARAAPTAAGPGREGGTRTFRGRGRTLASARRSERPPPAPPGSGETADMTHFNKGPSYGLSAEVKNKVRAGPAARDESAFVRAGGGTGRDARLRAGRSPAAGRARHPAARPEGRSRRHRDGAALGTSFGARRSAVGARPRRVRSGRPGSPCPDAERRAPALRTNPNRAEGSGRWAQLCRAAGPSRPPRCAFHPHDIMGTGGAGQSAGRRTDRALSARAAPPRHAPPAGHKGAGVAAATAMGPFRLRGRRAGPGPARRGQRCGLKNKTASRPCRCALWPRCCAQLCAPLCVATRSRFDLSYVSTRLCRPLPCTEQPPAGRP